ncbi:uncharacterized protein V1516DRAFT_688959 [Lipomyces oligophaga]|uniref:uncharacterized protein n=1 Tax=Lipomyces oligophaga TaxID=45792 RepID=UPI0034CE56F9
MSLRFVLRNVASRSSMLLGRRSLFLGSKFQADTLIRLPRVRFNSSTSGKSLGSAASGSAPAEIPKKKAGRLAELTKKYGWTVVWVYLGLSLIDYPFCFFAVHAMGQEKIGELEDYVLDTISPVTDKISEVLQDLGLKKKKSEEDKPVISDETSAELKTHKASIWTEAVIAYGFHKSLLVFRIPLAAAITPSVLKFCQKHFPSLYAPKPRFGVKADAKRRIGGGLF